MDGVCRAVSGLFDTLCGVCLVTVINTPPVNTMHLLVGHIHLPTPLPVQGNKTLIIFKRVQKSSYMEIIRCNTIGHVRSNSS